ncbi:hypothetical protein AAFF_G00229190 [Aldrovandia affinis]|uniref:Uncharacterized protein n=1 Tax=Aldrovandia affinis TaxID=143900 RepID=A0AAD7SWF4_9TELE|nr:hypothetical protein AAFF_G00229190 [Aldrovandia affinis]
MNPRQARRVWMLLYVPTPHASVMASPIYWQLEVQAASQTEPTIWTVSCSSAESLNPHAAGGGIPQSRAPASQPFAKVGLAEAPKD